MAPGRRPAPFQRLNPANEMTTLLGLPERRDVVRGMVRDVEHMNHRLRFGAISMGTLGMYPLIKAIQGALKAHAANRPILAGIRAALFN